MPAAIETIAAGTKKRLRVALCALVFPRFRRLVPYAYGHSREATSRFSPSEIRISDTDAPIGRVLLMDMLVMRLYLHEHERGH